MANIAAKFILLVCVLPALCVYGTMCASEESSSIDRHNDGAFLVRRWQYHTVPPNQVSRYGRGPMLDPLDNVGEWNRVRNYQLYDKGTPVNFYANF